MAEPSVPASNRRALLACAGATCAAVLAGCARYNSSNGIAGGQSAPAGPSIVSGPGAASTGYATPLVLSQAGQKVTYVNLDNVQHDVNSTKKGPDGRPVFHSKLIGLAESAPVQGAEKVPAGTYEFYCSVHPGMRGNLVVR